MATVANPSAGVKSGQTAPEPLVLSDDLAIARATRKYLAGLDPNADDPAAIATALVDIANAETARIIQTLGGKRATLLLRPTPDQVALTVASRHHVVRTGKRLGIYDPESGTYDLSVEAVRRAMRMYRPGLTKKEVGEIYDALVDAVPDGFAPLLPGDWIPFANGDLHRDTLELHAPSPDRPFVVRYATRWVPNAPEPQYVLSTGEPWTLRQSILDWANGDEEQYEQLLDLLQAALEPPKTPHGVMLFDPYGRTGKGTLLRLLRALIGRGLVANLSLRDLETDAKVAQVVGRSLILGDENPVGAFVKDSAILKSLISGDPVAINEKYEASFSIEQRYLVVQCLNGTPDGADRTGSYWRRQTVIPFLRRFAEGTDEVRDDFVQRPEVLEWLAWTLMQRPRLQSIRETQASLQLKSLTRMETDHVAQFWSEHETEFVWGIVPNAFAYDAFAAWMARNNPAMRGALGKNRFLARTRELIAEGQITTWYTPVDPTTGLQQVVRVGTAMDDPERLIEEYHLTSWMWPGYQGSDWKLRCRTRHKATVRGFLRRSDVEIQAAEAARETNGGVLPHGYDDQTATVPPS